ncbi:phage tail protein [Peribacillus simplex]|uniref:Phage tail protein n=2 Tax=Peribacillus TaxID=2675229 RepID=A0AA90PCV7_9BACI|nr:MULTISPECIES: phage tail protein [Peribacillus]MDP1419226.1 phage tail protein [Peribacillus simplex]MDP1452136.1 phage tail protein [Peribacillus frigoritolerans]
MLVVHSLDGQIEPLVDCELPQRRWVLNGDKSLSFNIYRSFSNEESFDLIQGQCLIEVDDDYFRVKQVGKQLRSSTQYKTVSCLHVLFDLEKNRVYSTLNNTVSIEQAMTLITANTKFTFTVEGTFDGVVFEEFGKDDSYTLLQKVLEEYGAELEVKKFHITLKKRIGVDNDFQFRYKHNITAVDEQIDTNDLTTYIEGTGKLDANGKPLISVSYESPNASVFGRLHADPISNETFTIAENLRNHIASKLQDTPKISIKFDYHTVVGEIGQEIGKGDAGWLIHEALGIEIYTRVVEILDYPGVDTPPVITIGNVLFNGAEEIVIRKGK